jgi:hypothetical protein
MKVLICGDSFASAWPTGGWPNLLSQNNQVVNRAQAGASEYRIWLQLEKENLSKYDAVIVCHTSPYRIFVAEHPIHHSDKLHSHCDFIYSDVAHYVKNCPKLRSLKDYFENWFDLEHAEFMHNLLCQQIVNHTSNYKTIHMTGISWNKWNIANLLDISPWASPGLVNHMDDKHNTIVYNKISTLLEQCLAGQ